jgi:POT family proton-dependent oligopeptide transporter
VKAGDAGRGFFGEPRALAFLAFTEAWERFSYYGMSAILALYMSQALFLPGRAHRIAGFGVVRRLLEAVSGPATPLGLASQVFGLYTALVYFTPVLGGWIADRFIGRRPAVLLGAALMCAGHFIMAFDTAFLAALALLILGCGLLKGNITAQVGGLYAPADSAGATRGFSIFYMGVNAGAVLGPLVVGLLADRLGWRWGFGAAGMMMLASLLTYAAGWRLLAPRAPDCKAASAPRLQPRDWTTVGGLLAVIAIVVFPTVGYYQSFNIGLVWIDAAVDRSVLGLRVPAAWFNAVDAGASIAFTPLAFAFWRWRDRRWPGQGEIGRIGDGAWITAAANLILVAACLGGPPVGVLFPLLYKALLGLGFLFCWPPLFALVSRAAPARIVAVMVGVSFLGLFVAGLLIGWLGLLYEHTTPAAFWLIHAAIAACGGVLALVLRAPLDRVFAEVRR